MDSEWERLYDRWRALMRAGVTHREVISIMLESCYIVTFQDRGDYIYMALPGIDIMGDGVSLTHVDCGRLICALSSFDPQTCYDREHPLDKEQEDDPSSREVDSADTPSRG